MTMDRLISVLVTIMLVEMMVAVGLGTTITELVGVVRNWRLMVRAALANYVSFPLAYGRTSR
jgi:predicted Na+-dependent transporter